MNELHDLCVGDLDLNLLVVFDVLNRTGSVTRAGQRLGRSQSAVSHALARLRAELDDPLFVRSGQGMVPTPRAQALAGPVAQALALLARAVRTAGRFDPATSTRRFRLVAPDLFVHLAGPGLLTSVRARAPGVDLEVLPFASERLEAQLISGTVDVAVAVLAAGEEAMPTLPTSGLRRAVVLRDTYTCFVDPAHRGSTPWTLDDWLARPHLLVSPTGSGPGLVDTVLATHGRRRRVALRVPDFGTALAVLPGSDLVLTAPVSFAHAATAHPLARVEPPLALPGHALALVWHERQHDDPGHRWLRRLLGTAAPTPA